MFFVVLVAVAHVVVVAVKAQVPSSVRMGVPSSVRVGVSMINGLELELGSQRVVPLEQGHVHHCKEGRKESEKRRKEEPRSGRLQTSGGLGVLVVHQELDLLPGIRGEDVHHGLFVSWLENGRRVLGSSDQKGVREKRKLTTATSFTATI